MQTLPSKRDRIRCIQNHDRILSVPAEKQGPLILVFPWMSTSCCNCDMLDVYMSREMVDERTLLVMCDDP